MVENRTFPNRIKLFVFAMLAAVVLFAADNVAAQTKEQFNSPLYAPKYYDPSQSTSNGLPPALDKIGIDQRLGEMLPLDAEFKDEAGQTVRLGQYFGKGRPIILALVYYECPMLCSQILNGLTGSIKGISFDAGKEFDVVAVSFDARENEKPGLAQSKKDSYLERYGRPGTENGWHFLTGDQASIDKITSAVGFNYRWDEKSNQFAHASAITIVTPDGKLSKYFYGIDYSPKDLKLGIMESAQSRIGTVADQLLLYCYHYDPATGKYGLAVMSIMRALAVLTLIGMGLTGFVFWRRNKKVNSEK